MKFKTLQIVWHDKQPVFSTEFLSNDVFLTSGGDALIRSWRVDSRSDGNLGVQLEAELTGMSGTVNCIRRSPKGDVFATGGDNGEVIVWKENPDFGRDDDSSNPHAKPWKPASFLRGHANDVQDMCWSSDSTALATASLEGMTIVWDVQRERAKARLCDHHHYVQGVAWDPFNRFLVTQGGDRRCKVYTRPAESQAKQEAASKTALHWRVGKTLFKTKTAAPESASDKNSVPRDFLFSDDTLPSFFRRLEWSPDGSFLIVPAGLKKAENGVMPVAYLYCRGKWSCPAACFPGAGEPFIVVRCCPVLFERNSPPDENALSEMPYAVVFACATLHNVLICNSTCSTPVAFLSGLHYSEITDMAWSPNGAYLVISSRDGYCSIVHFEEGDLGVPLNLALLKSSNPAVSDWFGALEEMRNRIDLLPAKRQISVQKVTPSDAEQEKTQSAAAAESLKEHSSRPQQPPQKKRITPVAVQSIQSMEEMSTAEATSKPMPALFSSTRAAHDGLFTDLHKLAAGVVVAVDPPVEEKCEAAGTAKTETHAVIDLLALSRSYASSSRFSQKNNNAD